MEHFIDIIAPIFTVQNAVLFFGVWLFGQVKHWEGRRDQERHMQLMAKNEQKAQEVDELRNLISEQGFVLKKDGSFVLKKDKIEGDIIKK